MLGGTAPDGAGVLEGVAAGSGLDVDVAPGDLRRSTGRSVSSGSSGSGVGVACAEGVGIGVAAGDAPLLPSRCRIGRSSPELAELAAGGGSSVFLATSVTACHLPNPVQSASFVALSRVI